MSEPEIIEQELAPFVKQKFLEYAEETIVARALAKVQDGLKPAQRYTLHAMGRMGLKNSGMTRKCAKVVGQVISEFSPHGDQSAYEALVGLAEPWSKRYPLITFQGNCGSVDGDGPAAMRYTECKLSKIGESMLEGLDKNAVQMNSNYDNTTTEPTMLSGLFPNFLANGTSGIATGLASKAAPHYAGDVFKAIKHVLNSLKDGKSPSTEEVIKIIKAPDFPTGGIIVNPEEVQQGYREGHGRVIIRGRYEIEEDKRGNQKIVLMEFPYNVRKSDVVANIGKLAFEEPYDQVMHDNVQDVIDESGKGNIRVVIKLKKNANADLVINKLYANTGFQSSFTFNNTVLVNGRPIENVPLLKLVEAYCGFQMNVKARTTKFDMDAFDKRLEIVNGFIKANEDIDAIIKCIRASENHDAVIQNLMNEFEFTESQARAIDARRLGSLNQLDADKLLKEADELKAKIAKCKSILSSKEVLISSLIEDIDAYIARGYFKGDERRTSIEEACNTVENRDLIAEEQVVMAATHNGMWKVMKADDYNAQKRGGKGVTMKLREDDFVEKLLFMSNMDDILVVTNKGRMYVVPAYRIPIVSRTAMGKYFTNYIDLQDGEQIVNVLSVKHDDTTRDLMFVSKKGFSKRLQLGGMTVRKNGINVCKVDDGDEIVAVFLVDDNDNVICATHDGFAINTSAKNVSVQGRQARGSTLIRFKSEDDYVVSAIAVKGKASILTISEAGFGNRTPVSEIKETVNRGGKGVRIYKESKESGHMAALLNIHDDETLFVVTGGNMVIRTPISTIPATKSRTAKGVRIVKLEDGDSVKSAVVGPAEEKEGDSDGAVSE